MNLSLILRLFEAVAEAADRGDHLGAEFLADAGDEDLDRVRIPVEVEDDGPGIPAERRDELFTRGTRLDTTGKPGTGLGLAIVRDVAEIYGGSIGLEESEDLGGLLARLKLPIGG